MPKLSTKGQSVSYPARIREQSSPASHRGTGVSEPHQGGTILSWTDTQPHPQRSQQPVRINTNESRIVCLTSALPNAIPEQASPLLLSRKTIQGAQPTENSPAACCLISLINHSDRPQQQQKRWVEQQISRLLLSNQTFKTPSFLSRNSRESCRSCLYTEPNMGLCFTFQSPHQGPKTMTSHFLQLGTV